MDLYPNFGPMPSADYNNPSMAPYLGAPGVFPLDLSPVPEDAALQAPDGSASLTPQGPINDLMALRSKYPYLPIMPFPAIVKPVFLTAATERTVRVPNGAVLLTMKGNLDFYVCRNGKADVPTAANTSDTLGDNVSQSFLAPQGFLWFVGGMNQFSMIAAVDTIVSLAWWIPSEYPR